MKFQPLVTALLHLLVLGSPVSQLSGVIPDQYIVVFHNHLSFNVIADHFQWLEKVMEPLLPKSSFFTTTEDPRNEEMFAKSSGQFWDFFGLVHKYHLPEFKGYSIRIPSFIVKLLEKHADIAFIEQDQVMSIYGSQLRSPSWGLTRISSREHPSSTMQSYSFPDSAGSMD
jgi:cerevisin